MMRIFLSSLPILAHLLCLYLPTTVATPDRSSADIVQEDHGVGEGSSDTIKAGLWESFLSPSSVIESVENLYLPSARRVTSAIQDLVTPQLSPSEVWEMAKESENALQDYVQFSLRNAATSFKCSGFTDIIPAMHHMVNATTTFRNKIMDALDARHITFDTFRAELEGIFMTIANDLENFPLPNKVPGHVERAEMVDKILDNTTPALLNLATRHGIEEEVVKTYLLTLKPHVHALVAAVGKINEQYPKLLLFIIFCVLILLIPQMWILGPLLRMFGFSLLGPVKGSAAAWMQSYFWGAAVAPGSWFSLLQAAGMGTLPLWAGLVTKAPLLASLFALFQQDS